MLRWMQRLLVGTVARSRSTLARPRRTRLTLEPLEERCTPADLSFGFAVSQIDRQVNIHVQDLSQPVSGSWTLTAPGQFLSVRADTFSVSFGTTQAVAAFAVGIDHQVYEALFDSSGTLIRAWLRVAPGLFDGIVVGTYSVNDSPIVFGVGTPEGGGRQIFGATFSTQGNLIRGWFAVAPGEFESLAMDNFASDNSVALFGVGTNHQVYQARFNGSGNFIDGWGAFAPGTFQSVAAAGRANGTLELFGAGTDGQAYAANFGTTGRLLNGWFPVNTHQAVGFTQMVAAPMGNGNTMAFALGTDSRAYNAVFAAATGMKISGWTPLDTRPLLQLAAGDQSGRPKMYAIGAFDLQVYFEVFDANGIVQNGLAVMPAGRFTQVDTAP